MEVTQKPKIFYGYIIIIASFFIMLIFWGAYDCFGVFFNSLINDFGWSRAATSGAFAVNSIAFGLACIPIAKLCGRYGPRLVIGICGVIMGLGYLLMSQISCIWQLYLYYDVLIAIGMGAYISLLPMAVRWFTLKRGFITGLLFSGMGVGGVIFPPVANWLISFFQWRFSFAILGIIVIVVVSIATQFLKWDPRKIGLLPYGETGDENESEKAFKITGITLSQAVHTRQFWLVGALYFTYLFCQLVVLAHIVIYSIGMNISPASAAGIISVFGVFQIVGMNCLGFLGDKYGNKLAFLLSFVLTAASFIWLLIAVTDVPTMYLFAAIIGIAGGGTQVLFSPIIAEIFGVESHGVILGSASFVGSFGAALGAFSAGLIFDITQSYALAFIICATLAALAIIWTLLVRPLEYKQ